MTNNKLYAISCRSSAIVGACYYAALLLLHAQLLSLLGVAFAALVVPAWAVVTVVVRASSARRRGNQ